MEQKELRGDIIPGPESSRHTFPAQMIAGPSNRAKARLPTCKKISQPTSRLNGGHRAWSRVREFIGLGQNLICVT